MHLLDTSALVKLANEFAERRVGPVRTFLARRRKVFISVVSIAEFLEGVADALEGRRFLADGGFSIMTLGVGIAERCAAMQRRMSESGQRLGENDAWIAATALASGFEVVGDDAAFTRVPGLKYRRV